jgi:hypothetical protein
MDYPVDMIDLRYTSVKEIAWLAGLLEGEGCFSPNHSTRKSAPSPQITLVMTDEDIVGRVSKIFNCHYRPIKRTAHNMKMGYKQAFRLFIGGAHAIGWMQTIYPFMGERRKEKIRHTLSVWLQAPKKPFSHHINKYLRKAI